MTKTPKPDLTEHDEEDFPFDEVMRRLVEAKPVKGEPKPKPQPTKPASQ